MSTVIDERVVSMQFDNKQFEKNVATSMSTLDKLKQKLHFKGATKGLEEVQAATKKVDFKDMEIAATKSGLHVTDVWQKFKNFLEDEIANSLKNTAIRITKAFTIDPIKTGLNEYETQLNAVQTILANTSHKGTTLDQVNAALDELNTYADKTIYNFTEMTRNIGTFTAAGIDLETSVSAIQGIANLAAVSGSTSQQASTAMYQLSQALASGKVRLMDWNSVVNAGMGGEVFQNALKETAKAHGVAIDSIIEKQGSFRESLSEEWLTADILTETLAKFTDTTTELGRTATDAATKVKTFTQLMDTLKESAQSGWAQTWRLVIGDFEEAKEMWTNVSEELGGIIGRSAEKRNKMLAETLDSGWDKYLTAGGIFDESAYTEHLVYFAKQRGVALDQMKDDEGKLLSVSDALRKSFNDKTLTSDVLSESLNELATRYSKVSDEELKNEGFTREQINTLVEFNRQIQNGEKSIDEFAESISKLSGREMLIDTFANIYKAIKNIITPIKQAWEDIFPSEGKAKTLYNIIKAIRNFTASLVMSEKNMDKLRRTFAGLFAVIDIVWTVVKTLGKALASIIKLISPSGLLGGILSITAAIGDFLVGIRDVIKGSKKIESFGEGIVKVFDKIITIIKNFSKAVKQRIEAPGLEGFMDLLKSLWSIVKNVFGAIWNVISGIGKSLFDAIDGTGINSILDLLNAGLLTSIFLAIRNVLNSIKDIKEGFADVLESVGDTLRSFQAKVKAAALKEVAIAIAILAASVVALSLVKEENLNRALAAISMLGLGLFAALHAMGNLKTVAVSFSTMVGLATAVMLVAKALSTLADIPENRMESSILALTVIFGALVVLINQIGNLSQVASMSALTDKKQRHSLDKQISNMVKQIVKIAFALIPMAIAMKIMGTMDWPDILKGLTLIVTLVGAVSAAMWAINKFSDKMDSTPDTKQGLGKTITLTIGKALQIAILAGALAKLAIAIALISFIDWPDLAKGFVVVLGSVGMIMGSMWLLSKMKFDSTPLIKSAFAIYALTSALIPLAISLLIVGQMKWDTIGRGLTAMTGAMAILAGALTGISLAAKINKKEKVPMLKLTLTLSILVPALIGIGASLLVLGQMKWSTIGKGLTAMAGTMIILAGALTAVGLVSKLANVGSFSSSKKGKGIFGFLKGFKDVEKAKYEVSLVKTAASMLIMAAAIKTLAYSIVILGQLKIGTILKGLLAIGGALTALALAGVALKYTGGTKYVLMMAGALALIGVACFAAAAGISLLLRTVLTLGDSLKVVAMSIRDAAPEIGQALVAILLSLITALAEVADQIIVKIAELIVNAIKSLTTYVPDMIDAFMQLFTAVITKIIDYIPDIVSLVGDFLGKLFGELGKLFKNIDPDIFTKLALALTGFAAFMLAMTYVGKHAGAVLKAIGVMIPLIVALGALMVAFASIESLLPGTGDFLAKGADIFAAIGTVLGALIGGLAGGFASGFSKKGIEALKEFADPKVLIALSSFVGLTVVLSKLTKNVKNMKSATKIVPVLAQLGMVTGAIVGLLFVLGAFKAISAPIENGIEVMKLFGDSAFLAGLLTFSLSVILITNTISVLNKKLKKVKGGSKAFTTSLKQLGMIAGAIVGLIVVLGALNIAGTMDSGIEVMKALGKVTPYILAFAGTVMLITTAINVLNKTLRKVKGGPKEFTKTVSQIGIITGAIIGLITVLGLLASIPGAEKVIDRGIDIMTAIGSPKFIAAISMLTGLTLVLSILGKMSSMLTGALKGIAAVSALVGAMAILCTVLGLIPSNLIDKGVNAINDIAGPKMVGNLALLSGLIAILALIGPLTVPALTGIAGLAAIVAALGVLVVAFGALGQIPGLKWLIDEGAKILESIGAAIGGFIGGIIGGIAAGIISRLPKMGKDIGQFMVNLKPFIDGLENMKPGTAQSAKTLASALLTLTGAKLLDGLGRLVDMILPGSFKDSITELAKGIKAFASATDGIEDVDKLADVAKAAKYMAQALDAMPRENGLKQAWSGVIDFDGITQLAEGIIAFNEKISTNDINADKIKRVADAGAYIIDAMNDISKSGGIKQLFSGEKDYGSLKKNLENFGAGISAFAKETTSVVPDVIKATATASVDVMTAMNKLSKTGGIKSWFSGDKDYASLKTNLKSFGNGVYEFFNATKDITAEDAASKVKVAQSVVDILSSIAPNIFIFGALAKQPIGLALVNLGTGIKAFTNSMDGAVNISAVSADLKTLSDALDSFSTTGIERITASFKNIKMATTLRDALNKCVKVVKDKKSDFLKAAKDIMSKFEDGVEDGTETIVDGFKSMITKCKEAVGGTYTYTDFYNCGVNAVVGFASGITDTTYAAETAATAMADAAVDAAEKALDEHSPSKRLRTTGAFGGKGFVLGLLDYVSKARDAGSEVADSAAMGISDAIARIGESLNDGIDMNPTITPVLDLSNISNGAGLINGMFGMNPSIGVNSKLSSISSIMNKNQNGGNDDVVGAIKDLKSAIENSSGDTYTIGGITYSDGSEVADTIKALIRAAKIEGRR